MSFICLWASKIVLITFCCLLDVNYHEPATYFANGQRSKIWLNCFSKTITALALVKPEPLIAMPFLCANFLPQFLHKRRIWWSLPSSFSLCLFFFFHNADLPTLLHQYLLNLATVAAARFVAIHTTDPSLSLFIHQ